MSLILSFLAGAAIGWFLGNAIADYIEAACNWFARVRTQVLESRIWRSVCVLCRRGGKWFKKVVLRLWNGSEEVVVEPNDPGVEIPPEKLKTLVKEALSKKDEFGLDRDDNIVVETYNS